MNRMKTIVINNAATGTSSQFDRRMTGPAFVESILTGM